MLPTVASELYAHFVESVLGSGVAYSVRCSGDLVAVHGADFAVFPLWPDKESADFFIGTCWPDLVRHRLTKRNLTTRLPIMAVAGIPVGIGRAPYPEAVVVPAIALYEDLMGTHAA
jgi:hypothetical protein